MGGWISSLKCAQSQNRCLGIEGHLALVQLARHPVRTGLTAGVLFVAVAMAVAFGQLLRNTLDDLRSWYRRSIPADFLVRAAMPDSALLLASPLPESLGGELGTLEGVERVDRIAFVPARVNGRSVLVLARTFAPDRPPPLDLRGEDPDHVLAGVRAGGAVLDAGLARSLGVGSGATVTVETARGERPIRVAGTANEYAAGGDALYLDWEEARTLVPLPGVHVFLVTARPGRTAEAGAALRRRCAAHGLMLQDNDDLRRWIDRSLERVSGALWGLTALAFVIASLGVANTMVRNVRQQRREFGMLRGIGLTQRQLRRVVLWQALGTALAGVLPGALAGVAVAYLLGHLSNRLLGRQVALHVEPGLLGGACALAVAAAVLAGLVPALRAGRLDVLRAVRT
jgi:putative ABC transport system permease protein